MGCTRFLHAGCGCPLDRVAVTAPAAPAAPESALRSPGRPPGAKNKVQKPKLAERLNAAIVEDPAVAATVVAIDDENAARAAAAPSIAERIVEQNKTSERRSASKENIDGLRRKVRPTIDKLTDPQAIADEKRRLGTTLDVALVTPKAAEFPPADPEAPRGPVLAGNGRRQPFLSRRKHADEEPKRGIATSPWKLDYQKRVKERAPEALRESMRQLLEDPDYQEANRRAIAARLAKSSFAEFFKQAWHVMEHDVPLVWNWHLLLLCTIAQAVVMDWLRAKNDKSRKYKNNIVNVAFNVPPGSSKSAIFARALQAWVWLHQPSMKVIALSINDDATKRDARALRELIKSKWYQESFQPKWQLKEDQDAVSNYGNTAGGDRLSKPMKSEIVGLRADLLIIDDANNPLKSGNRVEREEINELWSTNQYNRVNDTDRSIRFGIQQRTNAGDWTGHALKIQGTWSPTNRFGWLHVVLPAEYDPERKFVMPECLREVMLEHLPAAMCLFEDPRTEKGEPLDEIRLSKEYLEGEKKRWSGSGNYAGQMDQRPSNAEGQMVQKQWFNFCRLAQGVRDDIDEHDTGRPRPAGCHAGEAQIIHASSYLTGHWDFDWIKISLDPATKKTEKGSNWGLIVVGGKGGRRYVLDDRTQRGAFHEILEIIVELIRLWRVDAILVEPKAAGNDIMDSLRERMGQGDVPMIEVVETDPGNSDKEARLDAVLAYFKNNMVYLLDGAPWLGEFVQEIAEFPNGTMSDRVDAISQLLNHERGTNEVWPEY